MVGSKFSVLWQINPISCLLASGGHCFFFFFKGTREYAWVSALHLTLYPVPIDEAGFVLAAVYSTKRDP